MKDFNVPMALFDLVPVVLFFAASMLIGADIGKRMTVPNKVLYYFGIVLVTAAGAFKALYKLFYAAGVGEYEWMNAQFFTNQSVGFLLTGAALLLSLKGSKKNGDGGSRHYALLPTGVLVGMSVLGLAAMYAALCKYAAELKKKSAVLFFVFSFILSLGMGYLSSRDFDSAKMNWIAQSVNSLAQLAYLIGALILSIREGTEAPVTRTDSAYTENISVDSTPL